MAYMNASYSFLTRLTFVIRKSCTLMRFGTESPGVLFVVCSFDADVDHFVDKFAV